MHNEPLQNVYLWVDLSIEEVLQVDFSGERNRMIQFDFCKSLQIEYEPLQVDEEKRRQAVKTIIFLYGLHLSLTEVAEVVTDNFRLD